MERVIKNIRFDDQLWDLFINNGIIERIKQSNADSMSTANDYDAQGFLYLPTLTDMHIHLDKHFLGEPWRPLQPFITLPKQLKFEKEMLESMQSSLEERALIMAELMLKQGTTKIRTHVDVDAGIGLKHLEAVVKVREQLEDIMEIEIVAFPQQGLIRSNSMSVMKDALRNGADLVGGVDPAGLDRKVESSLQAMFELSAEFNAGVDLHLHDPGHLGLYTISLFADYTVQSKKQGRTAVSHAYCLGMLSDDEINQTLTELKEANVSIISSVPIDRPTPRAQSLWDAGVDFLIGNDNIRDAWSPFGNGDLLQRGSRLAEKSGWITDEQLVRAYSFITDRSLTPQIGEKADFMLVNAENLQHAIAAAPEREAVFSKGLLIANDRFRRFEFNHS
jgi:cytosine/adenosine deaminase-related metal-dependent hydrolase